MNENCVTVTEKELQVMARAAKGKINHIYLHWTGGHYGQPYDDYHISIDCDGTAYRHCRELTEQKNHTWLRNDGSIGITLCCGAEGRCWLPGDGNPRTIKAVYAEEYDGEGDAAIIKLGPEPPTPDQINVMAKLTALLCKELGLPIDRDAVMTHCEAAFRDGYGPGSGDPQLRWDLWFLPDPEQLGKLVPGGPLVRGKALFYREAMKPARGRPASSRQGGKK